METRKKILIVDDEQINVEFFDLMLSKLGFVVEKASNGRECLEKVKEFAPDLIMLDNIMPKMSGWEVTRILKNDPEYLEKVARERMGLIRKGETVYKVVPGN